MTDNASQQSKKQKKKNKNKQSDAQEGGKVALNSKEDLDLFSKFSKLLGQEQNVDFGDFDKHVVEVKNEIEGVQAVLNDINTESFKLIPEEEKREPNPATKGTLKEKDQLLLEVKKKMNLFESYSQKADVYKTELKDNTAIQGILDILKTSIQDDINRNDELYKLIESY